MELPCLFAHSELWLAGIREAEAVHVEPPQWLSSEGVSSAMFGVIERDYNIGQLNGLVQLNQDERAMYCWFMALFFGDPLEDASHSFDYNEVEQLEPTMNGVRIK